ncbi:hypothetical protein [Desulfoscipio gibsoniae]|uniref:Uncharacterized protein n=1 Tax=Desulfoscipio gibsoniae DSM 7213 TaxID=767817 RepID=R4KD74_9FIRM|nr:hypothetical protein [Desulfoscipio gibsoniae]AGL01133.1 hypothetical protein Desgi_1662 [Desulfoscipio gibsoniae DSM 7213]
MERQWQGINSQDDLPEMVRRAFDPKVLNNLDAENLISPLAILCDTRYTSAFNDPYVGDEYNELYEKSENIYNDLKRALPGDKHDLLLRFESLIISKACIDNKLIFQQGLRDGFRLAVELLAVQSDNKAVNRTGLVNTLDRHRKAL